jgi:methionyl-tRNA synthetase
MSQKTFYITSPIYYVNDVPHIGHAYTSIACDVMGRYKKISNYEVKFLTGTDEYGQKVEKSAHLKGLEPQVFVDKIFQRFQDLTIALNLSNDDFIRTTEKRHIDYATFFWNKLVENKAIYLSNYAGWYSLRDETYYSESEIKDGLAPTGAPVEWIEEESYFFNLSQWEERLLEFYEQNPEFVLPNYRFNEVKAFVKSGLKDLSVSRTSFTWGIKVPGNTKHVIYVWLDALSNYISALNDENGDRGKFWPADAHIVGKDILRFHAVYWPAFLMAAGIELPKRVVAHGWWTNNGQKISKSIGNVIDPFELIDKYGLDHVRYFLFREVKFGRDGDYSDELLINRVNSELVNNIGNLMQRSCTMLYKNFAGIIESDKVNVELADFALQTKDQYIKKMEEYSFSSALEAVVELASRTNLFMEEHAPWKLKDQPEAMMEVLYSVMESLRFISILLLPFTPTSANKMLDILNIEEEDRNIFSLKVENKLSKGHNINMPEIVFPRLEKC